MIGDLEKCREAIIAAWEDSVLSPHPFESVREEMLAVDLKQFEVEAKSGQPSRAEIAMQIMASIYGSASKQWESLIPERLAQHAMDGADALIAEMAKGPK